MDLLHHYLLWRELCPEDDAVDVVDYIPVMVFSLLTIHGHLVAHADVTGEVRDEILFNDSFNRNIGIQSPEHHEIHIRAAILVEHSERLSRDNCRYATVAIDGKKALILLVMSHMGHIINYGKELIVIVCRVIDSIQLFDDFCVIEVRANEMLLERLVGVALERITHENSDMLFEILVIDIIDECRFARPGGAEQEKGAAELGVWEHERIDILKRNGSSFGNCWCLRR